MSTHQGPALYLDATRTRVVEGGTDAAFLLVGSGCNVPPEFAELYGEYASQPAPEPEDRPERTAPYGGQPELADEVTPEPEDDPAPDPAQTPKPRKRANRNATD